MNWKKVITSAIRKGNLDLALRIVVKVDPEELFSLLKNFSEGKEDCTTHIAAFLDKLGTFYQHTQRFSEAEKAYNEALEKYTNLAQQNPDVYTFHVATILNSLGTLFSDTKRFSLAEKAYKEALEIRKNLAVQNPRIYTSDVAVTLNNLGIFYKNTGNLPEAEKAYKEALRIRRNLAEENPDVYTSYVAITLNNLGVFYQDTQRFSLAEKVYKEALKKYRALENKNNKIYVHYTASILINLGNLCEIMQKFSEAEKAYKEALKKYRILAGENPEANTHYVAATLYNIGVLYKNTQKVDEAENVQSEALEIYKELAQKNPDVYTPYVALTLNNLGLLYNDTQKFNDAENVYAEALEMYRALKSQNPDAYTHYVAVTLNNAGILYKNIQKFLEAEKAYKEALEIYRTLAQQNPEVYTPDIALTLNNLGLLYNDTQKFDEAEKAYSKALEIYKELAEENPQVYTSYVAATLNNLGTLYHDTGKSFEAEKAYSKALEIYKELAEENPEVYTSYVANVLNNLGVLYEYTQRFSLAGKAYKESLEIYRTLTQRTPEVYTSYVANVLNNLGVLAWSTQRFLEAETHYKEALKMYRILAKENPDVYTFHVALTLNNLGVFYTDTQSPTEAEKAYTEALEKYKKIRSWFYAAKAAHNLSENSFDKKCLEDARKLFELAILFSKEEKYKYNPKRTNEKIYLNLIEQNVDYFGVLEALRDPELLSLPWSQIVSWKELERAQKDIDFQKTVVDTVLGKKVPHIRIPENLPEDVVFIYIQKLQDYFFFFVVGNNSIKKFKCEKEFFSSGGRLLYNLSVQQWAAKKTDDLSYVTEKFDDLSRKWSETLHKNIRNEIQKKNYVVFFPDPYCSFLPLEALQIDGKSLCVEKTVVRAASLHQFLRLSERNHHFSSSLIVGNPWPGCDKKKLVYALPSGSEQFRISFLDEAEKEARALAGKLPDAAVLLKQEATGERFLSEVSRHSLIHFSGHGSLGRILFLAGPLKGFPPQFEPEEFSYLRKAERSNGGKRVNMMEEWHPITDLDLYDVKLTDGAVVFLNACETGQHSYAGGGYSQGLPAVFLKNGAHSVVSSLIPIFDNSSKEVALHFYENLLSTRSVSQSLRKARIWAKDKYKAQIYWIPYIHYGPLL